MRAILFYLTCFAALSLTAFAGDSGERFTSFGGFSLVKTTISDIQKKLGPAKIITTGDASSYDERISYAMKGGTIQFFQGEMNDGVGVCVTTDQKITPRSPWPKNIAMPQINIGGLELGISKSQFIKVINHPIQWFGYMASVHYEYTIPYSEIQKDPGLKYPKNHHDWPVWMDITGVFYNGRLIQFEITRTTTDG